MQFLLVLSRQDFADFARNLCHRFTTKMPGVSLANTIAQLGAEDEWGPEITTSTTLDGVPYAPYSKGDKLGRMADWTQEGKEGRDRGQRYGRGFRG